MSTAVASARNALARFIIASRLVRGDVLPKLVSLKDSQAAPCPLQLGSDGSKPPSRPMLW
jgi:hypothetical protein